MGLHMKYIDENKIFGILDSVKQSPAEEIRRILAKSKSLKRLSLKDASTLLSVNDPLLLKEIFDAAGFVKEVVYGRRIVLFAPLYISNICANGCLYCAFRADNKVTQRKSLSSGDIKAQTASILKRGHKRILMVSAEGTGQEMSGIDYYVESVKAIYSVSCGVHKIKRVNVNCAPLTVDEFKKLKQAGIGTYQLFQETYHEQTYRKMHPFGAKSDPDNRIDAVNRAYAAGIDDIGIGVLYGLYDYQFETLAMLMHVEELEKKFGVGPHTISVPRVEPAQGTDFTVPRPVSNEDFKKIVAVLRLSVPYTGIILTTREAPAMREELLSLGVSQISADSRTSPGGYSYKENNTHDDTQFKIADQRSLDDICGLLVEKGLIPSFCAACYRKERTGEAFMNMARPGTIKGKCDFNAIVTFKEYIDDFASDKVKKKGYALIENMILSLKEEDKLKLSAFFEEIKKGKRDIYV